MISRGKLLTLALYGVNALLLTWLGARIWQGSQRDALLEAQAEAPAIASEALTVPPVADFDPLRAQAVFHKTRSFYVPPAVPVVEQPPPALRFAGSMLIPNQPATAVLVDPASGQRFKVRTGDDVSGWSVAEVGKQSVVLQLGDRRAEISSNTTQTGTGMTMTSTAPVPQVSGGGVRVLSGGNAATSSASNIAPTGSPRLYRPPPRP